MLFTLTKNPLYAKQGDVKYVARARITKKISKAEVIEQIAYSCTLTDVDISAVLTALEKVLVSFVAMGCSIDLGFLRVRYSIRGGFDTETESFHKDRNKVVPQALLSTLFSEAVNKTAKPEKAKADTKAPEPTSITKIFGDKKTTEYKPGNHGRIVGTKLLFDEEDLETGVYLHSASGEPVRVNEYGKICDTSVVIAIPEDFPAGKTDIEVRTRSADGKLMRGNLEDSIMIAD
jgi:hypothetical protein